MRLGFSSQASSQVLLAFGTKEVSPVVVRKFPVDLRILARRCDEVDALLVAASTCAEGRKNVSTSAETLAALIDPRAGLQVTWDSPPTSPSLLVDFSCSVI